MDSRTENEIVTTFLSSSFHAEDEATPVVAKLLRHRWSDEERAILVAYAREEDLHARLIAAHFRRRALAIGPPFSIQRLFALVRARLPLLIQFYNVEILAGSFYGAMAARVRDPAARALIKRLLLDEARHIRLHRDLLARELARRGPLARLGARALLFVYRTAALVTARHQARWLAPILGSLGPRVPAKLRKVLCADVPYLFARPAPPLPRWFLRTAQPGPQAEGAVACSRRGRVRETLRPCGSSPVSGSSVSRLS